MSRSAPVLSSLIIAAGVLLAGVLPSSAGTPIQFPQTKPVIALDLPEGWTSDDSVLGLAISLWSPGGPGKGFHVMIMDLPGRRPGDLAVMCKHDADRLIRDGQGTDIHVGTPQKGATPSGMPFAVVPLEYKYFDQGTKYDYCAVFSPAQNIYFVLLAESKDPAVRETMSDAIPLLLTGVEPL